MASGSLPELSSAQLPDWYNDVLHRVKAEIGETQARASQFLLAANTELVTLYWRVGSVIAEKQEKGRRGSRIVTQLSADLRTAYPQQMGFSVRNLHYMAAFAYAWPAGIDNLPVSQLPWGHIAILLDKIQEPDIREFYAALALREGWSRHLLINRIISRLHERIGQTPNTFDKTITPPHQDIAHQLAREPYILDFFTLESSAKERHFHTKLVTNLTRFLQELGVGFAFVGSEYRIPVGNEEAILDLLFYHLRLHRYVIFELKIGKFLPEYVGKLNFYLNVVDDKIRDPQRDEPTIGILLVADHDHVLVEYALRGVDKPIAVSRYKTLPANVRNELPTEEELARIVGLHHNTKNPK